MAGEGRREEGAADHGVGVVDLVPDARLDLRTDALDRLVVEPRLAEAEAQHVEGLGAVLHQRAQVARHAVAVDVEAQFDGEFVEPLMKRRGVVRSGAFVEQAGQEVADTRLVGRILRGAARERELKRHQRYGVVLDQPSLDAAGRDDALDARGVGLFDAGCRGVHGDLWRRGWEGGVQAASSLRR